MFKDKCVAKDLESKYINGQLLTPDWNKNWQILMISTYFRFDFDSFSN